MVEKQVAQAREAARGRRCSPAERVVILKDAAEIGVAGAAEKHGCSKWTIYDWRSKQQRAAQRAAEPGNDDASSDDTRRDDRHRLILGLVRQQPGRGPSPIRDLLLRTGV